MPFSTQAEGRPMSHVAMLFGNETEVLADDFQIAGFERFSTVDWPGQARGDAVRSRLPVELHVLPQRRPCRTRKCRERWSGRPSSLTSRNVRGQLDGVVFSGGEPTRQAALIPAMQQARSLGFGVGLHSAGAYPARLARGARLRRLARPRHQGDARGLPGHHGQESRPAPRPGSRSRSRSSGAATSRCASRSTPRLTRANRCCRSIKRVQAMGGPTPVLQEARAEGTSEEFQRALGNQLITSVLGASDLEGLVVR